MPLIDRYSYSNNLRSIHPLEKILFSLTTILVCLVVNSISTSLLVILVMSICITSIAEIPLGSYVKMVSLPLSFLVLAGLTVTVTIVGSDSGNPNFLYKVALGGLEVGVQPSNLFLGLKVFLKSLGTVTSLYFLILTTPVVEIITVLRRFRFPKLFLELMIITYHLLFVLMRTGSRIRKSQKSRLGYSSLSNTMRSLSLLGSNIFVKSYCKARDLITALESRGYDGKVEFAETEYDFSGKNIAFIVSVEILFIGTPLFLR